MSIVYKAGYATAFMSWVCIWFVGLVAYGYHWAYTLDNIGSVEHSGYAFYLVAGLMLPPLGVFHSLFIWFG